MDDLPSTFPLSNIPAIWYNAKYIIIKIVGTLDACNFVASQKDKENSDKRKKKPKSTISLNQLKYVLNTGCICCDCIILIAIQGITMATF